MTGDSGVRFPGKKNGSDARILGLSTLERTLLVAFQTGVRKFMLIGDEESGDRLLSFLRADKRFKSREMKLDYVPLSALGDRQRVPAIRDPFWLLEKDLVFSPAILERAAASAPPEDRDLLVVALPPDGVDGDGSIPVRTAADGRTVAGFEAGPGTSSAVYGGIGLCAAGAFPRLARALGKSGSARIDAGIMQEAFGAAPASVLESGDDFCERIVSAKAAKRAERYLVGTARKPTDGYFSRHFNRHISLFLTKRLLKWNVTPMQISFFVLAVGLLSGWAVGRGGYANALLGAILFELASIIDGCDGENARLTFRGTKGGGTFDITADALTFVLFFLNLPIGLYRTTANSLWLVLGAVSFLSMLLFYLQLIGYTQKTGLGNNIIAVVKEIEKNGGQPGFAGRLDRLAAWIAPIFRRDFFSTWALIFILFGGAKIFMGIIVVLSALEAGYMFSYARRRTRQIDLAA